MDARSTNETQDLPGAVEFTTTHWSVILAARDGEPARALAALETLCRTYWYPLYAFVRRQGHTSHDAQDLTQDFFAHLLDRKDFLRHVSPARGRFRSFLLTCLKRFLTDDWRKSQALKRGGGKLTLPLDEEKAEHLYGQEPSAPHDAESIFERRWAMTLLGRVLDRLENEFQDAGKQALFERLQPFLVGEKTGKPYREMAAELGITESAIKMSVLRMRERYRAIFCEEVAQTVATPAELEEEISHLVSVLSK